MSDNASTTVSDSEQETPSAEPQDETTTTAIDMKADDDAGEVEEEASIAINDLGMSFADAINSTIVEFDDGDLVKGTVVKIDKDEVLLDIGFKSEGVIPAKELSIRNDADPFKEVELG